MCLSESELQLDNSNKLCAFRRWWWWWWLSPSSRCEKQHAAWGALKPFLHFKKPQSTWRELLLEPAAPVQPQQERKKLLEINSSNTPTFNLKKPDWVIRHRLQMGRLVKQSFIKITHVIYWQHCEGTVGVLHIFLQWLESSTCEQCRSVLQLLDLPVLQTIDCLTL